MKKIFLAIMILGFVLFQSSAWGADLHTRDTGSAAVATSIASDGSWQLWQVSIHLSAAGAAGDLTMTIDANAGAAYDFVLITQDMTTVTDYVVTFNPPIKLNEDDEVDIAWANGSSRTYGLDAAFTRSY